jgi:phosphohistidine phosphatase
MRVTLIRHGEAGDDAPRDEERALTKRGRADARRVGRALGRRGARFTAVVSSPLVRAVQTAEIVLAAMKRRTRVTVTDALLPEEKPQRVGALLASLNESGAKSVALVAHEPVLSGVAALLLGLARYPSLRKAEVLRIRMVDGLQRPGSLRWRIDPDDGRVRRV